MKKAAAPMKTMKMSTPPQRASAYTLDRINKLHCAITKVCERTTLLVDSIVTTSHLRLLVFSEEDDGHVRHS